MHTNMKQITNTDTQNNSNKQNTVLFLKKKEIELQELVNKRRQTH